jgi:hypothetical protein
MTNICAIISNESKFSNSHLFIKCYVLLLQFVFYLIDLNDCVLIGSLSNLMHWVLFWKVLFGRMYYILVPTFYTILSGTIQYSIDMSMQFVTSLLDWNIEIKKLEFVFLVSLPFSENTTFVFLDKNLIKWGIHVCVSKSFWC